MSSKTDSKYINGMKGKACKNIREGECTQIHYFSVNKILTNNLSSEK